MDEIVTCKNTKAITFDFGTLWSSTQVNKISTSERDKVSVALIKASSAEITKKLQVPVAEEEEENQNTVDKNNNSEQTLREEDGDDGELNSVNEDDGCSNERSDDATDENLVYILNHDEGTKTYNTRPDAGCAIIHERRIERFSCFAEVKAEYKKKDTLSTHQDLLRLALFGMNEIEDNDAKCILLVQVIGKALS
ncbi:hypothetical protein G6F37_009757 [Rhizopus arrhizus]|nr:hypothetical protein G6F38_009818 [Rhizopus arrhizus]KAG1154100.1 hypothetical protein G6F37_009757 [Rhizopus arrhizus]